jgi:RNA-binding protein
MTPEKRRQLRARAHALNPVVMVGNSGLSQAVFQEIERALKNHELIKIRVAGADRTGRERMLEEICSGTAAEPVQHIGRMLVIHRENPELRGRDAGEATRSGRRLSRSGGPRRGPAPRPGRPRSSR